MASLPEIVANAREIRGILKTIARLSEDIALVRESPEVDAALRAAFKADPRLKPVQNIINRAERLADDIQEVFGD